MGLPTPAKAANALVQGAATVRAASKHGPETLVYVVVAFATLAALAHVGASPIWIVVAGAGLIIGYPAYTYLSDVLKDSTTLRRAKNGVGEILSLIHI